MTLLRYVITITGTVQGVGFRPFVYRLATELGIAGSVRNTAAGVVVEAEGERAQLGDFAHRLQTEAPSLSRITALVVEEQEPLGWSGFAVIASEGAAAPTALIPPDVALCQDCAREIANADDRRAGYAFTNCTNCGPRFTVVTGIPYDRPQTTMAGFKMCPDCEAEYRNPGDRRFHAEPIACPNCGPRLFLDDQPRLEALSQAAAMLRDGGVLAIKGLGGYHLACDARNPEAVETLRRRKGRGDKPFAVMVRDLEEARRLAVINSRAETLLTSPEAPVVIAPARADNGLAPGLAPRQHTIGLMLPYTPMHRLLLAQTPPALVMTSGNLAEEPIIHTDDVAREKLGPIADHFLSHDRPIAVPCDDSVVRVEGNLTIPVRRARGYVPRSIQVATEGPPVLAVGGHHKSTFCLLRNGEAILSQHLGDLDSLEVLDYFDRAVQHFETLFQVRPEVIAHDLHPRYLATQWARSHQEVLLVPVQHHHAHVVSVMAELGLTEPVIGVSYDGTGYGPDGTIWGGEILLADRRGFVRAGHLRPVPLPGGEGAIAHPARMALSWLLASFGEEIAREWSRRLLPGLAELEANLIARQLERNINCPLTSSMGRLFDAVAALLGAAPIATYEGQPAMELEALAAGVETVLPPYQYELTDGVIDARPLIRELVEEAGQGIARERIAARFHETVAVFTADLCVRIKAQGGPAGVVLCGGVMQNARLVARLQELLLSQGSTVHLHREAPPNDGGLSLGQAVIAAQLTPGRA